MGLSATAVGPAKAELPTGNPAIEITSLRKTYGPLVAVDDVSLTVRQG